jgi:hypothetical protein
MFFDRSEVSSKQSEFDTNTFFGNSKVSIALSKYIGGKRTRDIIKSIANDDVSEKDEDAANEIENKYGFFQAEYLGDCEGFGGTSTKAAIFHFTTRGLNGGAKPKRSAKPTARYSAADAAKDKKAFGVKVGKKDDKKPPIKESGQISMMMRIGDHVMIAEPQPATIKVKGDLSQLKTEFDEPTSGYTGFENKPKATSAAQAARTFSKEETRVKPLSELFMSKPQKGLVEEQLMGKGLRHHFRSYQLQEF